jgi:division protein 1
LIQRSVFELAKASPKELVRSTFSTSEIQHRALAHLPDHLLRHIPERTSTFSLFQGFQASKPEEKNDATRNVKGQKLLDNDGDKEADPATPAAALKKLKSKKSTMEHRLDMMGIRKNMCISEIKEIDTKITNLNTMRKIVLQRLAGHEQEEVDLENEIQEMTEKLQDMLDEIQDAAAQATKTPPPEPTPDAPADLAFMSESVYEKLPAPSPTKTDKEKEKEKEKKKRRVNRRKSMPVLHEHMEKGSRIREFQAHNDMITALDFDAPFGTLVSAALDDTVRVWDLNAGRCIGLLEGHHASVRCLQVQDNFVATGSMDANIRFWDLNQAEYSPPPASRNNRFGRSDKDSEDEEYDADMLSDPELDPLPVAPTSSMQDCLVTELSAHVAEVTALHFHKNTLVSGSADKTLRQWDLENGRCVQTLDVMWAAAQASVSNNSFGAPSPAAAEPSASEGWWRPASGRLPAAEADFVGAIQVFETALACGTADGMVRLWDLRSGSVHRSLVGHTGPITSLAFSGIHMVTGSADRSVRVRRVLLSFPISYANMIYRSGTSVLAGSSMHSLTTRLSSTHQLTLGISCRRLVSRWSRFTTRQTATNGIADPVHHWMKKTKGRFRPLNVFASRTDIWLKAEKTVLSECGHVDSHSNQTTKCRLQASSRLPIHMSPVLYVQEQGLSQARHVSAWQQQGEKKDGLGVDDESPG